MPAAGKTEGGGGRVRSGGSWVSPKMLCREVHAEAPFSGQPFSVRKESPFWYRCSLVRLLLLEYLRLRCVVSHVDLATCFEYFAQYGQRGQVKQHLFPCDFAWRLTRQTSLRRSPISCSLTPCPGRRSSPCPSFRQSCSLELRDPPALAGVRSEARNNRTTDLPL